MSWFDYIRNNFLLKVFSLALALLIWLAVRAHLQSDSDLAWNPLQNIETDEYEVPVKLLVKPSQGPQFKVSPEMVKIMVSGDATEIKKLTASKIQVYARIDDVKSPMMSDFPLEAKLPREITLEAIEPERVSVETTSGSFLIFPPTGNP